MTIFVLKAGTYTPVCLLALDGVWRLVLLGLVWGLALCGVLLLLLWMEAPRWLSVILYVTMGWPAVVAASAIFRAVPAAGIVWLLAGGVVYSVGALIYGFRCPDLLPRTFRLHELSHPFVLAGSACYFWAMLRYIAPL